MSDTVTQIKEKLSILDVVTPYVKIVRAGKYYKGLSPFTKEKTPSFFVSPDRGLYHCFSTGKGGDMFTFIEEMEGVDFRGALKILADKAGVEIEERAPGERDLKERLYAAVDAARAFYERSLVGKKEALRYLMDRGVKDETVAQWSIGYAPNEWRSLHDELMTLGFTDLELERAGLAKRPDKEEAADAPRLYDRFRGRIMFPIRDVSGRTVGFSGRVFEDDPKHPGAKYINSPETDVFDKSRVLFGIERAREGIRALSAAILVEGQFDLLMSHQAGYKNAVATSGTAFTESHAALLKRYTPNLLIAYDGDRAGIAAAGRAAAIALRAGMNVKIAKLPPGADPADLVKDHLPVFKEAVKGALHVVDFYLSHIADAKYDPRTFRLEVSRTVLPYVAMIENRIDQAHFIERVAEALQVPADAVAAEVRKAGAGQPVLQPPRAAGAPVAAAVGAEPFLSRGDTIERLLFGLLLVFRDGKDDVLAERTESALHAALPEAAFAALGGAENERAALFEAEIFLENIPEREDLLRVMDELYAALKHESAHERYRETLSALRAAELSHDSAKADELLRELHALAPGLE